MELHDGFASRFRSRVNPDETGFMQGQVERMAGLLHPVPPWKVVIRETGRGGEVRFGEELWL
jgi:hypothetical protein